MLRAKSPNAGKAIRALSEPLARQHGLDYDSEALSDMDGIPATTEAAIAFTLVYRGSSLVLNLAEPDPGGYPGIDNKARRRGAKAMAKTIGSNQAASASAFMGHALFEHMAAVLEAAGHPEDAGAYRSVREFVKAWYPMPPEWEVRLDGCSSELYHLLRGTSPDFPINGFHMVAKEGRNPREQPEMVEVQRREVGTHFRREAARAAIEMCLGDKFDQDAFLDVYTMDVRHLEYSAGELSVWNSVSNQWRPAVGRAIDALAPAS